MCGFLGFVFFGIPMAFCNDIVIGSIVQLISVIVNRILWLIFASIIMARLRTLSEDTAYNEKQLIGYENFRFNCTDEFSTIDTNEILK